jgi:hypothetical protein
MPDSDFSLEPLFNQSSQGDGLNRKVAFVPIDLCGAASHRTALTINSTAQEVTIGTGKRTIEFHNAGNSIIYYGGTGVTSANGIRLFPAQTKSFANVKDTFAISFVTDGAETSTLAIVEFN